MRVGNGLSESPPQAVIGPLVLVRQASSDQLGSGSILEGLVTAKRLTDTAALDRRKDAWAEAYRSMPHGQPVELHGHSAVSMTSSSWKERGVCAAGAANVRTTGKSMVWKTRARCATVRWK